MIVLFVFAEEFMNVDGVNVTVMISSCLSRNMMKLQFLFGASTK